MTPAVTTLYSHCSQLKLYMVDHMSQVITDQNLMCLTGAERANLLWLQ